MSQRSYPLVLASWLMVVVASLCWGQSTRPTTQPADMTVEAVRENIFARLLASVDHAALPGFETDDALQHITPLERTLLSTGRVSFHLDAPATLYLLAPTGPNQPFWLDALGFEPTDLEARVEDKPVAVWRKPVEAGRISLGINSLTDERYPYFLAIVPRDPQAVPTVSELTPETLRVEPMLPDSPPYVDRDAVLRSVPEVLQGSTMVRTSRRAFRPDAILSRILQTDHVASTTPDQIVLTWSDDPRTTQSINWRTSTAVTRAQVRL
ncbi:MAG TPA: fibronectin type III domain-containing protein [Tepidisphaeraceae bacterium]|nr:fibronectin type III domain-containing protein [Tepidisphaeraceae bacterium]